MTEEQKSGSKLLAEFEGLTIRQGEYYIKTTNAFGVGSNVLIQFSYHTDYNELMRVWVRFLDLKIDKRLYRSYIRWIEFAITNGPIQDAFVQLVEGVKYLNSLKPKEEKK